MVEAVRFELTMTGFADRRLYQLGYACTRTGRGPSADVADFADKKNDCVLTASLCSLANRHLRNLWIRLGAGEGSRTLTELSLSQSPLPIGPRQHIAISVYALKVVIATRAIVLSCL